MPGIATAEPLPPGQRIATLDVLRGVAICGILLMNIFSMGGAREYPLTSWPARWNLEWVTWGAQTLFVQGAMRGLFTLLFGASMLLMLRRADAGETAPLDAWARRSLALMGFGVAQFALFLWPGEILWNYGVSGLFLLAFRTARPRTLLVAAGLLIAALSVNAAHWTGQEVSQLRAGAAVAGVAPTPDQRAAQQAEAEQRAAVHPSEADVQGQIAERTHLRSLLRWSAKYWMSQNLSYTGWADIAESVSFMLVGMALFRLGVLTGEVPGATYTALIVLGYGGGLALRGFALWLNVRTGLDMGAATVGAEAWTWNTLMFEPGRLLVTLGHVGMVLTLFRSGVLGSAPTLRALGRMTLTVYCLQSIIGSALFYGLGYVGAFGLAQLWLIAAGIWVVTGLFCRWWFERHAMGPAEQVLRWIAYGRVPAVSTRLATVS